MPYFLSNINQNGLDASIALMGTDQVIIGAGELLKVTVANEEDLTNILISVRGSDNSEIEYQVETEITAVDPLPTEFKLGNNYPNPFNPQTTISFDLPSEQKVRLSIYDISGRLIKTLVSESMEAGSHDVVWAGRDENGRGVSSGVYYYRIDTGIFSQTRKMTLLK
jgi:hypothetical protein